MSTKKDALEVSRILFNERGVMNVTLRDVAKHLDKSYGNISYHFPTKEDVIVSLLNEMNEELLSLPLFDESDNTLMNLLNLPAHYYSISLKYLFFVVDYLELRRNFPNLQKLKDTMDIDRKRKWMSILIKLRKEGYFTQSVTEKDLEYIMFLSFSVRVTYFQIVDLKSYKSSDFILIVNKLLQPYLSKKGNVAYGEWLKLFAKSK